MRSPTAAPGLAVRSRGTDDLRSAPSRAARSPIERLEMLCDRGSVQPLRTHACAARSDVPQRSGDGVVAALGQVRGQPVACYAEDPAYLGGSLGAAHAESIERVLALAARGRLPVVGFVASAGARIQEGAVALDGYARIFRRTVALRGRVPQISVVCGSSAGGGCYLPALTDFVLMTADSALFLTGPAVVEQALGERVSASELGGAGVHARNGVCDLVVSDDLAAAEAVRELLGFLRAPNSAHPVASARWRPELTDPAARVPLQARRAYDVRDVLRGVVDERSLLELGARHARNIVTGLARIDGRPVGVVANQPKHLGGVIDIAAAQKAARFVDTCDARGLPLIAFVDTPGFLPGTRQEHAAIIRHGAALVRAFAAASVPKLTVVVRKAFGGAYITMNCKELGADLVLAWPRAQLGIMSAECAVAIVHRREIASTASPERELRRLAGEYAVSLDAAQAAAAGHIDEVIAPRQTRKRLSTALAALTFHASA